jgi:predicted Ser/Thr protein kinase/tetratricopeptide (TPR) repeat protein
MTAPLATGGTATVHALGGEGGACVMKIAHGSAAAAACLRNEAAVLERLGAPWSPSLVGRHDTVRGPSLVLERIDGTPLSEWCRVALPEATVAVATRLVERIAGIHARGVVHGDLSGHNVLVTSDGDVRIIDFGSARRRGVAGVDGHSGRLATPAYLAPDAGTSPTLGDDIYAAGVLLYELCAARLPFDGAAGALRLAHAMRRPARPSSLCDGSRAIDRVVLRCLAKARALRYRDGIALREAWHAAVRARCEPGPMRTATRAAPVSTVGDTVHAALLGFRRTGELMSMVRAIEAAGGVLAHSHGRVCVVAWTDVVEPARAAQEAQRQLQQIGGEDFVLTSAPVRVDKRGVVRGAALSQIAGRIQRAAERRTPAERDELLVGRDHELAVMRSAIATALARHRPVLVTLEAEAGAGKSRLLDALRAAMPLSDEVPIVRIAGVMGDPAAPLAQIDRCIGAGSSDGARSRVAAAAMLADRLRAWASNEGLVLVLDDVQWIDSLVLEAACRAVADGAELKLAIVAAGRRGSFELPAVRAVAVRRTAVELRPLDPASASILCRALLHDVIAVPAAVIDRIATRAAGLPLFIHELVRGLRASGAVRDGRLELAAVGQHDDIAVIEWAVERELAQLGPELRGHLFLAAVLGPSIDEAATALVIERLDECGEGALVPLDATAALQRLVDVEILVRREGRLEIRHALVRDAVLHRVPAADRATFATAACDVLGSHVAAPVLATWAEHAQRRQLAVAAWLRASDDAVARHDHLAVETACSRALAYLEVDDARRGAVLARRARARYRLGEHATAATDFAAAASCTNDAVERASVLLDEAMALDWARDFAGAAARTEEAAALLGDDVPSAVAAPLALAKGRVHWRAQTPSAARPHLERALDLAARDETLDEIAIVAGVVLGWVLSELGDLPRAREVLAAAGTRANAAGDRLHEAAALNNQAYALWCAGRTEELPAIYRRVVALGRELGMPTHEYRAESWIFAASLFTGDLDNARAHAVRMVELEAAFPVLFPTPRGVLALGRIAARAGDLAGAHAHVATISRDADAKTRLLVDALALALAGVRDAAPWHALVGAARAEKDDEAAVEIAIIGARVGAPLVDLMAELATIESLAPAVRTIICR